MHPITPARLAWAFFLFVLGGVSLACVLCSGGCATVSYDNFHSTTLLKDISGEAEVRKPDGTHVKVRLSSNVAVEALGAVAEGAAKGAAMAVKP